MNLCYADSSCELKLMNKRISVEPRLADRLIAAGIMFSSIAANANMRWKKHYVNATYSIYRVWLQDGSTFVVHNMKQFCAEHFRESYGYVVNRLARGEYKGVRAMKLGEVSVTYPKASPPELGCVPPVVAVLLDDDAPPAPQKKVSVGTWEQLQLSIF